MIQFNSKEVTREAYAVVGYAMYEKGMTKAELSPLNGMDILLLKDEFEEWLEKKEKEKRR